MMNKKTIIILLAVLVFIAISYFASNSSRILLNSEIIGTQTTIKLQEKEHMKTIDSVVFINYVDACKINNGKVFINKVIEGDNYIIYISMGTYKIIQMLVETENIHIVKNKKKEVLNNKDLFTFLINDSTSYMVRSIYTEQEKDQIIIFDYVSNDSVLTQNAYSNTFVNAFFKN